jgi:hypothetical protein
VCSISSVGVPRNALGLFRKGGAAADGRREGSASAGRGGGDEGAPGVRQVHGGARHRRCTPLPAPGQGRRKGRHPAPGGRGHRWDAQRAFLRCAVAGGRVAGLAWPGTHRCRAARTSMP